MSKGTFPLEIGGHFRFKSTLDLEARDHFRFEGTFPKEFRVYSKSDGTITLEAFAFGVPMSIQTYLVENVLCDGVSSLRKQVISSYSNFMRNLQQSQGKEICLLYKVVENDPGAVKNRS